MAITTNKYLTSHGTDINKKGIEPNIVVELPKDAVIENPGDKSDIQLKRAMDFLKDVMAKKDPNKKIKEG